MRVDYALRQHDQWYRGRHVRRRPRLPLGLLQQLRHPARCCSTCSTCVETRRQSGRILRPGSNTSAAACGHPRTPHRPGRHVPGSRPLDRLSLRRVSSARANGAAARAARRRVARASSLRLDGDDSPVDRRSRDVRRGWLASHRVLWAPAGHRRVVYLDRQPLPVCGWTTAARACAGRSVLVLTTGAVDIRSRVERPAVPHRSGALSVVFRSRSPTAVLVPRRHSCVTWVRSTPAGSGPSFDITRALP